MVDFEIDKLGCSRTSFVQERTKDHTCCFNKAVNTCKSPKYTKLFQNDTVFIM